MILLLLRRTYVVLDDLVLESSCGMPEVVRSILMEAGEDPGRESLLKTPDRVARMLEEITSGHRIGPVQLNNGALSGNFQEDYAKRQARLVWVRDGSSEGDRTMFDFSDQVVIVTGASGNLGSAVVRAFHTCGAHIVAPGRRTGGVEELFPDLAGSQDHLLASGVDVTNPVQVEGLVQEAEARFGRIDVLINTLGGYRAGTSLHETTLDTWDFLLNLNARSVFITSRAVIPIMLKQEHGKIVNIGSHSALKAQGNDAAYSAAKSAVMRLTESMSAEYKNRGLRINTILPAALVSPAEYQADPTRGVTPDMVAQVVLFLCSSAGSVITGAHIPAYGRHF